MEKTNRYNINQNIYSGFISLAVILATPQLCMAQNSGELDTALPFLTPEQTVEQPQLAGQGFRTTVFGEDITVPSIDRRLVNAWVAGIQFNNPRPSSREFEPVASLYFWRHPENNNSLLHADIAIFFNNIFYAEKFAEESAMEWVLTFENYTIPSASNEIIDGEKELKEEIYWGYVRPGFGLGLRKQVAPGHQDNMMALDWTIEPGFLYFGKNSETAGNFVLPDDTFELRTLLTYRWDALQRNTLSLAHSGFALGADFVYGHRFGWNDWGINGEHKASDGRNYASVRGYASVASNIPFVTSQRHKLIGLVRAGTGHNIDRFNQGPTQRVFGGINPVGEEYHSLAIPILPGAASLEYYPEHFAMAYAEYRYAATFFTYLSGYASTTYMNPQRRIRGGIHRKESILPAVGARVTTGFFGDTRLVLDYSYNFGTVRKDDFGGHSILLYVSGEFGR